MLQRLHQFFQRSMQISADAVRINRRFHLRVQRKSLAQIVHVEAEWIIRPLFASQ